MALQVTCEKVTQAYVNRCKQVNPLINAIVEDRFKDAIKEAQQLDKRIKDGEIDFDKMPLLGVPITSKDSIGMKGWL